MKIWQKYFLTEYLKIFALFIVCFYGLYILIDYSSRSATQYAGKLSFGQIAQLYVFIFIQRMDILIPFGLLVAGVKTYCSLNVRNELVALMSSGVKLGTLVKPFVAIGLSAVLLLYINEEFFMPHAYAKINFLKDLHSDEDAHRNQERNVQSLEVENSGRLIFHSFNTAKHSFFDVYWVKSEGEIYKIKYLQPAEKGARGEFVDHFLLSPKGEFTLASSSDTQEFGEMEFDPNNLRQSMIDPRQEPVSELFRRYSPFRTKFTDFQARAATSLYNKLIIPWLCLLAVIGPIPYCFRYTRQLPIFMIYLVSMMTLVSFYLIMNAALLFGENQVFSPFAAIVLPFAFYYGAIYYKYKGFLS